jgi:hypothetical protein
LRFLVLYHKSVPVINTVSGRGAERGELRPIPDLFQSFPRDGRQFEELGELVAGIFSAVGTVLDLFLSAAIPDFTDPRVAENAVRRARASIADDIFGFDRYIVLAGPFFGNFFSQVGIILLSGDKRSALAASQTADRDHFGHGESSVPGHSL